MDKKTTAETVTEYLARGGKVTLCEPGDSVQKNWPVRSTKKSMVNFIRRRSYARIKPNRRRRADYKSYNPPH